MKFPIEVIELGSDSLRRTFYIVEVEPMVEKLDIFKGNVN